MPYKFITNLNTKWKLEKTANGKVFNYWRKVTDCSCNITNEKVLYSSTKCVKPKKSTNLTTFDSNGNTLYNFSYNTHHANLKKRIVKCPDHKVKNSNPYFYQYGGVSSSSRIARLKYDAKRSSGDKRGGATRIDRTHVVNTCFSGC